MLHSCPLQRYSLINVPEVLDRIIAIYLMVDVDKVHSELLHEQLIAFGFPWCFDAFGWSTEMASDL